MDPKVEPLSDAANAAAVIYDPLALERLSDEEKHVVRLLAQSNLEERQKQQTQDGESARKNPQAYLERNMTEIASNIALVPALVKAHRQVNAVPQEMAASHGAQPVTRLYRAEGVGPRVPGRVPDWIKQGQDASGHTEAAGRWFTSEPDSLKWYQEDAGPNARVSYVDVPTSDLEKYRVANSKEEIAGRRVASFSRDPETEFFLPRDLAESSKIYTPTTTPKEVYMNDDLPINEPEVTARRGLMPAAGSWSVKMEKDAIEALFRSITDDLRKRIKRLEERLPHTPQDKYYEVHDEMRQLNWLVRRIDSAPLEKRLDLTQQIADYSQDPEAAEDVRGYYETEFEKEKEFYEATIAEVEPVIQKLKSVGIEVETGVTRIDRPDFDHHYDSDPDQDEPEIDHYEDRDDRNEIQPIYESEWYQGFNSECKEHLGKDKDGRFYYAFEIGDSDDDLSWHGPYPTKDEAEEHLGEAWLRWDERTGEQEQAYEDRQIAAFEARQEALKHKEPLVKRAEHSHLLVINQTFTGKDFPSAQEFWDQARKLAGITKENGYDDNLVRDSSRDTLLSGRDVFSPPALRDLWENGSIEGMEQAQREIDNHVRRQCFLINSGRWPGDDDDGPVPSYSQQAAYPRSWDDYESYESSSQIMVCNVLPDSKTQLNEVHETTCGEFQPEGETYYHLVARFSEEGTRWAIAGFYQDNFDDRFNRMTIVHTFDSLKDASEWVKTERERELLTTEENTQMKQLNEGKTREPIVYQQKGLGEPLKLVSEEMQQDASTSQTKEHPVQPRKDAEDRQSVTFDEAELQQYENRVRAVLANNPNLQGKLLEAQIRFVAATQFAGLREALREVGIEVVQDIGVFRLLQDGKEVSRHNDMETVLVRRNTLAANETERRFLAAAAQVANTSGAPSQPERGPVKETTIDKGLAPRVH